MIRTALPALLVDDVELPGQHRRHAAGILRHDLDAELLELDGPLVLNINMGQVANKRVSAARPHMLYQNTFYKGLDVTR